MRLIKGAVQAAVQDKAVGTATQAAEICGVAGIIGSLVMLLGDVLLYGPGAYGQPASTYFQQVDPVSSNPTQLVASLLGTTSAQHTVFGAVLGPLAGTLCLVGCLQMLVAAVPVVSVNGKLKWAQKLLMQRLAWGLLACGIFVLVAAGTWKFWFLSRGCSVFAFW